MLTRVLQWIALLVAIVALGLFYYLMHLAAQGQARAEWLNSQGLLPITEDD
jgi:hypothetical protein